MFQDKAYRFKWADLGDIEKGRPNLGNMTNVAVYRLMHFSTREVLIENFGVEKTNQLLFQSGKLAGQEFCRNLLNVNASLSDFIAELYETLLKLKVGILRVEKSDPNSMHLVVTVSEDLECSGLPVTGATVCDYDEGFLAGVLGVYLNKEFSVKEIDCWSTGDRTCRFRINPQP
ncbi:hypothetical protein SAMN05660860_02801 [Geoalkalibacter ferrihydriticus]|uniref:4-vinyl reductase n=2 Tax=Geoalkalibacter ferrihydriticus TaxID=392333 RepID=A0A0C2HT51_9BACT|nr:V4R domain-containing protein [Geoalkalibacter ferrihydriticus]KIH75972.1 4-vinyl reductase [Geoalkalibacter ferrihydriticus DSM 17813]SDM57812.1 hypothetical protein SAMN05660860_02801 [Geoalkalibacter ferrihydriticus]